MSTFFYRTPPVDASGNTNLGYILHSGKIFFSFEDIFKSQIPCLESCKAQGEKVKELLSHTPHPPLSPPPPLPTPRQVTKQ